jgi:hypothetical protein
MVTVAPPNPSDAHSLALRLRGSWRDVVGSVCAEIDAIVDLLRSGLASCVLILPLEVVSIANDGDPIEYGVRLRVVWEPARVRCQRPDAWLFSSDGDPSTREQRLAHQLARAKDAYLTSSPPLASGPVLLPHAAA